jgi:RNA polymerase subunit RPABC4/transcription elongation factor Spt4
VWRLPETITGCRNCFTGSVTAAWSGRVVIGRVTPAIAEISDDQPAVQLITVPVAIGPRLV